MQQCYILLGDVPDLPFAELGRAKWDGFVDRFVNTPASVLQCALESFVPGGSKDPRLYAAKTGTEIIGPSIPAGKVSGVQRARAEVFRGALRPFATTVVQELADVLKLQWFYQVLLETWICMYQICIHLQLFALPPHDSTSVLFDASASHEYAFSSKVRFWRLWRTCTNV